jgi:dTDP-4-dehydrorhamnose reductase
VGVPSPPLRGIVSGGQTGVDRAALDVALRLGIPVGGWCPAGRVAEDGPIGTRYPLRETPAADPAQRTGWNVFDTDATLLLSPSPLAGGTELTRRVAERHDRPTLLLDPFAADSSEVRRWLDGFADPILLNVAGPRESERPGIGPRTARLLETALAGWKLPDAGRSPPRRALVTGGAGLLGRAVVRLAPPGWEVHSTHRVEPAADPSHRVELSDRRAVAALFDRLRPDLVIHTAYSAATAPRDIRDATRRVTDEAARTGAFLIHLSSDTVLDGEQAPYAEDALPAPVSDYGRWKAGAESYVLDRLPTAAVVRTSLITSLDPPDPRTDWVLSSLRSGRGVDLYVDELRCPILVDDLARQIWEIARLGPGRSAGVWHLAGPEAMSRYTLGTLIAGVFGLRPATLRPALSPPAPDLRPRDLRLLTARADRELPTRARSIAMPLAQT